MPNEDEKFLDKAAREINAKYDFLIELGLTGNTVDYAIRILDEFYDTGTDLAIPYSQLRSIFDIQTKSLLNYVTDAIRSAYKSDKVDTYIDLSEENIKLLAEMTQADFDAALQQLEEKDILHKESRTEALYHLTPYAKQEIIPRWQELGPVLPLNYHGTVH
ncbi:MAG: hypothetical protein HY514_02195 [Candidatus Aenigmarchaeota archaeon]|nr:hypothetical protein [Candidatus Aenigmarchaeota archaeon]